MIRGGDPAFLRQRAYRERKMDRGICVHCTRPARPGRTMCAQCAETVNRASKRRYRETHPDAKAGLRRCTLCREQGHYRQRCPNAGKEEARA